MTEIELVQELMDRTSKLPHRDDKALDALQRRTEMVIRKIFGESSKYLKDLKDISFHPWVYPAEEHSYDSIWNSGQARLTNLLGTMLEELNLFGTSSEASQVTKIASPRSSRIFIIHGHDEAMKQTVARILERLGLEPIILHERPNKGRTIIEKFTDYTDVGFAIVLISPDDFGYIKGESAKNARPRARQNVILELGFFMGKLGRNRVFPLYKEEEGFELPSDYSGVLYTPYDRAGRWQLELVKELKAAGYNVDANKLV